MTPVIFLLGQEAGFQNYSDAVRASEGRLYFSTDPADSGGCDGLLLPGGGDLDPALYGQESAGSLPPDRARDRAELELIRRFCAERRPVFGVCRGLQILNVAFGGTLVQDLPGHGTVDGRDRLHSVCARPGSFAAEAYGERFRVNSAHHQAVRTPGAGLEISALARDGVIEALEHKTLPVWGVQWHPERLTGRFSRPNTADGGTLFAFFLQSCRR